MTTAPPEPPAPVRARKAAQTAAPPKPKVRMPKRARTEGDNPGTGHWRLYFLEKLVETSNVTAAARYARIAPSRAYRTRKHDPKFAALWDAALLEGYKNLEMDLLAYLRNPAPEHKLDVASAIRLLTLHRQAQAQRLMQSEECTEQEALEALDRMLEEMRQRSAANAELLDEDDLLDDADRSGADDQAGEVIR